MSKISVGGAVCLRPLQLEILKQVQDDERGGRVQREHPEILPLNNPDDWPGLFATFLEKWQNNSAILCQSIKKD